MTTIRSTQRLSDEARQTIWRTLGPTMGAAEVQRLIDGYEGTSSQPDPGLVPAGIVAGAAQGTPTVSDLFAPGAPRDLEDGKQKLAQVGGKLADLGGAAAGVGRLFTDSLPYDSMLERSYRNCRASEALLPAVAVALRGPEPQSPLETLDLAEKMFNALSRDSYDPMQKGFAGLRLLMAVTHQAGDVRVLGLDDMAIPLLNLRDDAKSDTLAQMVEGSVKKSFSELRAVLKDNPNPTVLAPSISTGEDTVTIGGVTLAIRK